MYPLYLLLLDHVLIDETSKAMLMARHNVTDFSEVAAMRFSNDVAVLNFYFDTPIITQIRLELRTSVFDKISAVGGILGLFTGISIVTFVEIVFWIVVFFVELCRNMTSGRIIQETHQTPQKEQQSQIRPYYGYY